MFGLAVLLQVAAFTPQRLSPFRMTEARALLERRLPCLGCHEIGGSGGRVGPSLSGIAARRPAAFVYAMIADPQRAVPGTIMPRVPLSDDDRALVADYLLQLDARPLAPTAVAPTSPLQDTSSAALYARTCAPCHGATGQGDGPNAQYLPVRPTAHADADYMSSRSDDELYDAIAAGGAAMNRSNRMPPFGASLTPAQIGGLVRYLRVLCRCAGPAWSRPAP